MRYEPIEYEVRAPGSIAEGEEFTIELDGLQIKGVDDRCGVLSQFALSEQSSLTATVSSGLLAPYLEYGRLGQLNFSRRTFFLECESADGVGFHLPITMNILPRYETAPVGEIRLAGDALQVRLLIRNNTSAPLNGQGRLRVVRHSFPFAVNTPAGGEQEVGAEIPGTLASLLSVGDNRAMVVLSEGAGAIETTLTARELFESEGPLRKFAESRITPIGLPEAGRIADTQWRDVRKYQAWPHQPWGGAKPPLEALEDREVLTIPELPGVRFKLTGRKFIPVSAKTSQPAYTIDLKSATYKKLYLLVIPFLESDDMFADVARVTVRSETDIVYSRTLRFPGDLDWFWPPVIVGSFATAAESRPGRFDLLPQLLADQDDWPEGAPPEFPQPEFWATCQPVITPTCVMSVVEIDLGKPTPVKSLMFESLGVDPAFGIVAITAETPGSIELLRDTVWFPPARFRGPRVLFAFDRPDALRDWKLEGEAFGVNAVPRLFDFPTLNSLGRSGEQATGRALSPEFTVSEGADRLVVEIQGGRSETVAGKPNLALRIIDAQSGEPYREIVANGSHVTRRTEISLAGLQGRTLRLELVDANTNTSYAWLGIRRVLIVPDSTQR